jgi:hypothetical protein
MIIIGSVKYRYTLAPHIYRAIAVKQGLVFHNRLCTEAQIVLRIEFFAMKYSHAVNLYNPLAFSKNYLHICCTINNEYFKQQLVVA